jgi:hypothetical protein
VTAPLLSPIVPGAVGFSAAGPVAGSLAAGWQSSMGLVAAGSPFAILQSAAMGGVGAAGCVSAVAGTIGATVGAVTSGISNLCTRKSKVDIIKVDVIKVGVINSEEKLTPPELDEDDPTMDKHDSDSS